jgi:hypothetical protein
MSTQRSLVLLGIGLLGAALITTTSPAQHGGHMGGDDPHQGHHEGMTEHMEDMHSDEMMEQMSTMMDHMSEMIGEMHDFGEQLGPEWQDQEHMAGMDGDHAAVMRSMVDDMDEMLPHMDAMITHLHSLMNEHDGEFAGETTETLMKQLDTMLRAGRDFMATIHAMHGAPDDAGAGAAPPQPDE